MAKADIIFEPNSAGGGEVRIRLNDRSALGKQARLVVRLKAKVRDSRAVNAERVLHQQAFALAREVIVLAIPDGALSEVYSYQGKQLELRLQLRLVIDDGVLFDSEVESEHPMKLGDRPRLGHDQGQMMDPKDAFDFFANLSAIPARNRMITLALTLVGGVVVIANALIGLHDEMVPEVQTLFYDHSGSDGSESPLMKALTGSGVLGAAIWMAIKMQLRKYMQFALKAHPPLVRGLRLPASSLIDGVARVDLEDITVRVVACNRECGQYKRGSGTKERTVSFRTATRAVKLYERYIALVPAQDQLALHLDGEIDFEPMFAQLYPPLKVGSSHGVEVAWEVQLLHPKFVDHEIDGAVGDLRYADFLDP